MPEFQKDQEAKGFRLISHQAKRHNLTEWDRSILESASRSFLHSLQEIEKLISKYNQRINQTK